jgi:hypothetical protein
MGVIMRKVLSASIICGLAFFCSKASAELCSLDVAGKYDGATPASITISDDRTQTAKLQYINTRESHAVILGNVEKSFDLSRGRIVRIFNNLYLVAVSAENLSRRVLTPNLKDPQESDPTNWGIYNCDSIKYKLDITKDTEGK